MKTKWGTSPYFASLMDNWWCLVYVLQIFLKNVTRHHQHPGHDVGGRKRLYDGLTETDKTNREKYLSIAFQSLGRAMHLVQDMAVPAHTRNDFHPPESYEKYTSVNVEKLTYTEVPFPLLYSKLN